MTGTVELFQAAGRDWDVVIIGAGVAGAMAALSLRSKNLAVLLVDRANFPRWKVCGCCLNQRGRVILERAGVGGMLRQCGAVPLRLVRLGAGRQSALVQLSGGVALSREAFDSALVEEAIRAGTHFLPGTRASLDGAPEEGEGFCRLWLHQEGGAVEARARVILAADGLGGAFLARAGLTEAPPAPGARLGAGAVMDCAEPFYQPGTVYMACGRAGYVGLVRLEDGRLDLAAALDAEAVRLRHRPSAVVLQILEEVGWPMPGLLAEQPWKGTPPLTRRARQLAGHRVFVLGDAAGYVEPFTGEGMSWALASGEAVAPLAVQAVRKWTPDLPARWATLHRKMVTSRQIMCRLTATVLRRPALTRFVVGALAWAPALATPFVRLLNHPTEAS